MCENEIENAPKRTRVHVATVELFTSAWHIYHEDWVSLCRRWSAIIGGLLYYLQTNKTFYPWLLHIVVIPIADDHQQIATVCACGNETLGTITENDID